MRSAEAYLSGLRKYGIRPSLERIAAALDSAGRPDRSYRTVLITGTNGKGTCAKALAEILRAHGIEVGLYLSPHLFSYPERFELGGKQIPATQFEQAVSDQRVWLGRRRLTEFEFLTLLAYRLFAKRPVEWAVMEVGMGGRWDATNAADPSLSVITGIGVDHTEFLGRTRTRIAFDKAHVARPGRSLLVGPVQTSVRAVIRRVASEIGARPVFLSPWAVRQGQWTSVQPAAIFGTDLALAILAAKEILGSGFQARHAQMGLSRSVLPGRFQWETVGGCRILFDVAHNEQAFDKLFGSIPRDAHSQRAHVMLGMQKHKRGEEAILRHLMPGDTVHLVRLDSSRTKPWPLWQRFVRCARRRRVDVLPPQPMAAVRRAVIRLIRPSDIGVVTGSFLTVREGLVAWR